MTLGHGKTAGRIVLAVLAFLLVGACRSTPPSEGIAGSGPEPEGGAAPLTETTPERVSDSFGQQQTLEETDLTGDEMESAVTDLAWAEGRLETVYFEFDRSGLTEQTRAALDRNAEFLVANPAINVRVEGHCDERGTIEYNLALGDRRATAARSPA